MRLHSYKRDLAVSQVCSQAARVRLGAVQLSSYFLSGASVHDPLAVFLIL